MKEPTVYIMSNKINGTLYTGISSDLKGRVYKHKNGITKGFTQRYNCKNLVYYEMCETMEWAITREKQIKARPREYKLDLINKFNPDWKDLYETLF
jgi:putative endonuclease